MKRFSKVILIVVSLYVAVDIVKSEVSTKLDEYSDSDDVSSFSDLMKGNLLSLQDLEPIFETNGEKQITEKLMHITDALQKSLDPYLKNINNKLTDLLNGNNLRPDSVKQSAINDIRDSAESILMVINKAENEIDSQSIRDHKPGYEGDDDEDKDQEIGDWGHESGHGGHHKPDNGVGLNPECKPSVQRPLKKLQLTYDAKAKLSLSAYKIMLSIVNALRKSDIKPSLAILRLLDKALDDAYRNVRFGQIALRFIVDCTTDEIILQKLMKMREKNRETLLKIFESRFKEVTAEYNEHLHDLGYCRRVTSSAILTLRISIEGDISQLSIRVSNGLNTAPSTLILISKYKILVEKINKLLIKCGITI